ncbi:MAG: hypothetical protein A2235_00730 [Deltaproteobacteria bacterium RIFOXYA2_FULL_42_10]|nr:MAG: hypothetical protein A2235_00730 [Deltaproteobacteria bacterium RIFOXYA2_FULL_42_10]
MLNSILNQIAFIRKGKGYTQAEIAAEIRLSRTSYVRKENGTIPLTLKEFLLIADFLEVQPGSFFKSAPKKTNRR